MNQKNWKKQISVYKFMRIRKHLKAKKIRGLYSSALCIPEVQEALESYELDGFIYMFRQCEKQNGDRLKAYFVRYKIGTYRANREYILNGGSI
jgi:hypothetical protein